MGEPRPKNVQGVDYGFNRRDVGGAIERLHNAGTSVVLGKLARERLYSTVFNGSPASREYDNHRFVQWTRLNQAIGEMGLFPQRVTMDWDASASAVKPNTTEGRKTLNEIYANNFMAMMRLEGQRPGIVKELGTKFGIHCFTRYIPHLGDFSFLINQYDDRHKRDKPAVVLATTYKDTKNNSFHKIGHNIRNLQDQLENDMRVHAYEIDGIMGERGLVRALFRENARYGSEDGNLS